MLAGVEAAKVSRGKYHVTVSSTLLAPISCSNIIHGKSELSASTKTTNECSINGSCQLPELPPPNIQRFLLQSPPVNTQASTNQHFFNIILHSTSVLLPREELQATITKSDYFFFFEGVAFLSLEFYGEAIKWDFYFSLESPIFSDQDSQNGLFHVILCGLICNPGYSGHKMLTCDRSSKGHHNTSQVRVLLFLFEPFLVILTRILTSLCISESVIPPPHSHHTSSVY